MAMSLWGLRFPELAVSETRSITIPDGCPVPAGNYGFIDFVCDDIECDCRRVIINVVSEATGPKVWATISYGWESPDYYRAWMGDATLADQVSGVFLDPIGEQSEYSDEFLDIISDMIERDRAYAERLARHYWMYKASLRMPQKRDVPRSSGTAWTPPRRGKMRKR